MSERLPASSLDYFVQEPTVDVIIVNCNYAHFVTDAIRSVRDQSYQNFGCIIVDNGSNDESVTRITESIGAHPRFKFLRLPSNLGHLGGALWALQHATGEFVTFLDADDVLFPTFLANHLQVHLGSARPVAFTSSNYVDVNANGELLTSGSFLMHQAWLSGTPTMRSIEHTVFLKDVDERTYLALAGGTRFIPSESGRWCWCQGSSNMLRRALLDRVRPAESSAALFGGVDGFFLPILHALTGTILIDQHLSAYRVHDSNNYAALPDLNGLDRANSKVRRQIINLHLRMVTSIIDNLDDIVLMTGPGRYWDVFARVTATRAFARETFSHPEFKAALVRRYRRLIDLFGELHVFLELRKRLLFSEYLEVLLAASERRFPVALACRATFRELRRKCHLLYQKLLQNRSGEFGN
jgi:glycosyltransferase involved in cell wall biosynthesis